ncbi:MAG: hypothetical protein ACJ790_08590 [Myxococcaceae bacterium]
MPMPPQISSLFDNHAAITAGRIRQSNKMLFGSSGLLFVLMFVWPLVNRSPNAFTASHLLFVLIVVGTPAGLALLIKRTNESGTAKVRSALEDPQNTLWVYAQVRKVNGTAVNKFIIFKRRDGSESMMAIPFTEEVAVLATLSAYLPHATFGYGDAQQAEYSAKRAA